MHVGTLVHFGKKNKKPFKDSIKSRFHRWFQTEGYKEENRTNSGYIMPPCHQLLIRWIVEEWENFSSQIIIKSFKTCGITLNLNHCEDNMLNPRIEDHFLLESKLSSKMQNIDHPYSDGEKILEVLKDFEDNVTFEASIETQKQEDNQDR